MRERAVTILGAGVSVTVTCYYQGPLWAERSVFSSSPNIPPADAMVSLRRLSVSTGWLYVILLMAPQLEVLCISNPYDR